MFKKMNRTQAIAKARQQSKNKSAVNVGDRAYAFRAVVQSQYYESGGWYTQLVGPEKSFNVGGKENVICYKAGKRLNRY